jgi:hypothetical protein
VAKNHRRSVVCEGGCSTAFAPACRPGGVRERNARSLADHYYVGGQDIQARFEQLYKHRNECVHGKLPFPNAYEEGTQNVGQDAAVRVEYLAEALAREAILAALRDPAKLIEFESRDRLEDAWAKGRFP